MSYSGLYCERGFWMVGCWFVVAAPPPQNNADRNGVGPRFSCPSRAYLGCPPLLAPSPRADTELGVLADRAFIGMPQTNELEVSRL